jgi:hypothetical protein
MFLSNKIDLFTRKILTDSKTNTAQEFTGERFNKSKNRISEIIDEDETEATSTS